MAPQSLRQGVLKVAVVVLGNVLKKDLKAIEARHGRAVRVAYAKVARAALKVLIEKAPVDTGQLVSNYRVGLGRSAPRAQIDPYAPGKKGSTAGANRAAAYAAAAAKLTNIKDLSQDIRIVNIITIYVN